MTADEQIEKLEAELAAAKSRSAYLEAALAWHTGGEHELLSPEMAKFGKDANAEYSYQKVKQLAIKYMALKNNPLP